MIKLTFTHNVRGMHAKGAAKLENPATRQLWQAGRKGGDQAAGCVHTRVVPSCILQLWPAGLASKVSHFQTFGPWLYSSPSVFLGPKVSWHLELIWLSKQKLKTGVLDWVRYCAVVVFPLVDRPNDLQMGCKRTCWKAEILSFKGVVRVGNYPL